jgi:hypothetical protein
VDCLQVSLSLDMRAPPSLRAQVYELLSGVNARASLGLFEMREDGEILFRFGTALLPGEYPGLGQTAGMIDVAMEAADRFFPAFDFLVRCGKPPAEALAACMFETVGVA